MDDNNPEPCNTDVSFDAFVQLLRSRCDASLDPDRDTTCEDAVRDIREVCDNILGSE